MPTSVFLTKAVQASLCVYDYSNEFLKAFCEHCYPSTNTLIIPQGELSISLWDLLDLGGLSATSSLFDEVVPTAKCFSQSLHDDARIPMSYRFLFSGYHYLVAQSLDERVSTSAWISFWNRSLRSYVGYEATDRSTSKGTSLNIFPHKSSMLEHRSWDTADRYPFYTLRVSVDLEEEVYCAGFLYCWLCVFVLHVEPLGFIRASVFKMASFTANGSRVSLAPPVLTCIYRSLSQISFFDNPSIVSKCFPAHYVFVTWKSTRPDREQPFFYDDHKVQLPVDRALFVSLRTGRVCHRIGSEFIVEPYNPYHLSPQFGYTPTIPGLSNNTREMVDLSTGLEFWRSSRSSKRKRSSSSPVEDRDPKHDRGVRKETSSSRGSRVVSPVRRSLEGVVPSSVPDDVIRDQVVKVSSSVSSQDHIELVDTGESPECLAIEVSESCPPALPTLTIAQGEEAILRIGASSLRSYVCDGLRRKSPVIVLKEVESAMKTFKFLTQMGSSNFPVLHDKLQSFFQKAREMDTASAMTLPDTLPSPHRSFPS
ncbi:hypothetical protein LIER_00202 [Lithospermum erythrorhizon]|uniref:Aminotransferase-like plant mobile domain-containing protein n=1 Tax=Lithospermum erythrorhizon TaxID=34254 RepID=A0AAV3NK46_LITER